MAIDEGRMSVAPEEITALSRVAVQASARTARLAKALVCLSDGGVVNEWNDRCRITGWNQRKGIMP